MLTGAHNGESTAETPTRSGFEPSFVGPHQDLVGCGPSFEAHCGRWYSMWYSRSRQQQKIADAVYAWGDADLSGPSHSITIIDNPS